MHKLAVVILNYNGIGFLRQFIPGILSNSSGFPVFVADNHSTDGSVEFLTDNYPQVQVILLKDNLGYAGGYNTVLEQIHSEYFVLLNSDVEVTTDWLVPLIKFMDEHPDCAACQPKIRSFRERNSFEYAGAAGGYIDRFGFPFCRGRVFNILEEDNGQYNDNIEVFWASGACLVVRSVSFKNAGGFDNDFFAHMEEIDLCWRIKRMGQAIFYVGDSLVYHVGGGTLAKSDERKTFLNFRNNLVMLIKNLSFRQLIWCLPVKILLDSAACMKFLVFDSKKHAFAVIRAHFYLIRHFMRIWRKRDKNLPFRTSEIKNQIFMGSIALHYYLFRKKKFTDLDFNP